MRARIAHTEMLGNVIDAKSTGFNGVTLKNLREYSPRSLFSIPDKSSGASFEIIPKLTPLFLALTIDLNEKVRRIREGA